MKVWRWIYVCTLVLSLVVGIGVAADDRDDPKTAKIAPRLKVDPSWPKPLPNNWVIGQIGGIAVDSRDHVWVLQRPRSVPERYLGPMLTGGSVIAFPGRGAETAGSALRLQRISYRRIGQSVCITAYPEISGPK